MVLYLPQGKQRNCHCKELFKNVLRKTGLDDIYTYIYIGSIKVVET